MSSEIVEATDISSVSMDQIAKTLDEAGRLIGGFEFIIQRDVIEGDKRTLTVEVAKVHSYQNED